MIEEHIWLPPSPTDENTHTCPCRYCEALSVRQHVYTNDCDTSCNHCKYERITQHVYDNEQDTTCNVCSEVRTVETLPSNSDEAEPSTKPNSKPDTNNKNNNDDDNDDEDDTEDIDNTTIIIVAIAGAVAISTVSIFGTALVMKKKK